MTQPGYKPYNYHEWIIVCPMAFWKYGYSSIINVLLQTMTVNFLNPYIHNIAYHTQYCLYLINWKY